MTVTEMIAALRAGIDAGIWAADSPVMVWADIVDYSPSLRCMWAHDVGGTDGRRVLGYVQTANSTPVCVIERNQKEPTP